MTILLFFLIVTIIVGLHELGHLLIGLWLGAKPTEYSIGFGKTLYRRTIKGIDCRIRLIPLGGFVKFQHKQYSFEPTKGRKLEAWKWVLIALAGPLTNIVLAYGLIFGLLFNTYSKVFLSVDEKDIIYAPGLTSFQKQVLGCDGDGPRYKWDGNSKAFLTSSDTPPRMERYVREKKKCREDAFNHTNKYILKTSKAIVDGMVNLIASPKTSKDLAGPVGIAKMTGEMRSVGVEALIFFLAAMSLMVGVFNLFPLGVLDGGRILFAFIEIVIRREPPLILIQGVNILSMVFLIGLMVWATVMDFIR